MRKTKLIIFVLLTVLSITFFANTVSADMGPKPFVEVEINGMENISYTVTLISKKPSGPGFNYEDWLKYEDDFLEYHPIMEYVDEDGYMWVGNHWELEGNTTFTWGYYPPSDFKILILTDDGDYYVSKVLNRYAFASYYNIDLTDVNRGSKELPGVINLIEKDYKFDKEIISFITRLIITVLIEIGIAWLFMFRSKKEMLVILIVNIITQIFLNGILNITSYYQGAFSAILLLVIMELLVLGAETIFYTTYFKNKRLKAAMYGVVANLVTFGITLVLFLLELNFIY